MAVGCPSAIAVALWWLFRARVARVGLAGVPFPCGAERTFGGFEAWQTAALSAYKKPLLRPGGALEPLLRPGVPLSHCCGLVVAFACGRGAC